MFICMGLNISNEGGSHERLCLGLERLCQDKTVVSTSIINKEGAPAKVCCNPNTEKSKNHHASSVHKIPAFKQKLATSKFHCLLSKSLGTTFKVKFDLSRYCCY